MRCYDALTAVSTAKGPFSNKTHTDVDVTVDLMSINAFHCTYGVNGFYIFSHSQHAMEPPLSITPGPLPNAEASTALMMKKRNPFSLPPLAEALGVQATASVELDEDQRRELKVSWEKRASRGNVFYKLLDEAKRRAATTTTVVRDGVAYTQRAYTLTDDEYAAFAGFYFLPEVCTRSFAGGGGAASLTLHVERPANDPALSQPALPATTGGEDDGGQVVWAMWRRRVDTALQAGGDLSSFPFDRQTLTLDLRVADDDAPFNLLLRSVGRTLPRRDGR